MPSFEDPSMPFHSGHEKREIHCDHSQLKEDETGLSYHENKVEEVDDRQARVMGLVTANVLLQLVATLMLMMQLQFGQEQRMLNLTMYLRSRSW